MGERESKVQLNNEEKLDSGLLKEILREMKCEFNREQESSNGETSDNTTSSLEPDLRPTGKGEAVEPAATPEESEPEQPTPGPDPLPPDDPPLPASPGEGSAGEGITEKDLPSEPDLPKPQSSPSHDLSSQEPPADENQVQSNTDLKSTENEVTKTKKPRTKKNVFVPPEFPKRSLRMASKDSGSILQSAIDLKEKSLIKLQEQGKKKRRQRLKTTEDKGSPSRRSELLSANSDSGGSEKDGGPPLASTPGTPPVSQLADHHSSNGTSDSPNGGSSRSSNSSSTEKSKKKAFSFASENELSPVKRIKIDVSSLKQANNEKLPISECDPSFEGCECRKLVENREAVLYARLELDEETYRCQATDSWEDGLAGCSHRFTAPQLPLLRASAVLPFLLLCPRHCARLLSHHACPICSRFCTLGVFLQCDEGHLCHEECVADSGKKSGDSQKRCPHCSRSSLVKVSLSLGPLSTPQDLQAHQKSYSQRGMENDGPVGQRLLERDELSDYLPSQDLEILDKLNLSPPSPSAEVLPLAQIDDLLSLKPSAIPSTRGKGFYQACKTGQIDKVFFIIESYRSETKKRGGGGGDFLAEWRNGLEAAVREGHIGIVHLLATAGLPLDDNTRDQFSLLMTAVAHGHDTLVKYLVAAGSQVAFQGAEGMTALHIAAKTGRVMSCHYLLLSTTAPPGFINMTDDGDWTPLVWASENGHVDVVRYLLEKRADPEIRDSDDNRAIHWAAYSGSPEICEDLLNVGSPINAINKDGDTPLHIAARQGSVGCLTLLLARGARTDLSNTRGELARDCLPPDSRFCQSLIDLKARVDLGKLTLPVSVLSQDISKGREKNPIECVNDIDESPAPTDYTYITENCVTFNLPFDRRITSLSGCKCEDKCPTPGCLCVKNSLKCWYDFKGRLLPDFTFQDPPMIFECNDTCGCDVRRCGNRTVQRGLTCRLEVKRTEHKEWGVFTKASIVRGTYVCEYIGEIISDGEADMRPDDSYLFDLDGRVGEAYCLDARRYGNVARFINHSCSPNLKPVRVFTSHQNLLYPRIALFASRHIPAGQELSFDYGEKFWLVKYKKFTCACQEPNCKYSAEKISETIEKYNKKLDESQDFL